MNISVLPKKKTFFLFCISYCCSLNPILLLFIVMIIAFVSLFCTFFLMFLRRVYYSLGSLGRLMPIELRAGILTGSIWYLFRFHQFHIIKSFFMWSIGIAVRAFVFVKIGEKTKMEKRRKKRTKNRTKKEIVYCTDGKRVSKYY